jgi:hypothetical protein
MLGEETLTECSLYNIALAHHKIDLLGAAIQLIGDGGRRDHLSGPRDLPNRVRRLIELGDQRREATMAVYLDDADWHGGDTPDDLSGLIVVRDLRD